MKKFNDIKITPKLVISAVLVAGLFTALSGYLNYEISKDNLRESIKENLALTVQNKKEYLDKFLDYHKGRLADWSSDRVIRDNFEKITENQDKDAVQNLANYIKTNKHSLVSGEGEIVLTDIFDLNGVAIISTIPERIGHTESLDELDKEYNFSKAKAAKFGDAFFASLVHEPDEPGHLSGIPMWHVSVPLVSYNSNNKVIGVMVNHILADGLNKVLLGEWPINSSAKWDIELPRSYLVGSRDKLVITPTGFEENNILEKVIDTEPVRKCAKDKQGMVGAYKNHAGAAVLGASLCIGDDWVLLTEVKEITLFFAMKYLKNNILLLSFLTVFALLVWLYILSRNIIRPIKKLSVAAEKIAKGDLSQRVPISSNDEIGKLSKIFNDMVQKLEETDRAKSDFVSLASHQLLTPLTNSTWLIETVLGKDGEGLSAKSKEYLQDVHRINKNMIDLVRALLDVSRIEMGTFYVATKPVNVIKVADSVLEEMTVKIKEKRLIIKKDYEPDIPIMKLDPELTRIIFQNLISNAVKYTPESGDVNVSINKKDGGCVVKVSDSGYGIPKELQKNVFSKFFRAYNIKNKVPEGTGLGLYIVKSILDNCGGKIWFESEEGRGTTFYVSFPPEGMKEKSGTKQLGA